MKCLARESEDALETAKVKLREIGLTLQTYQRFIKVSNMCRSRGGGGGGRGSLLSREENGTRDGAVRDGEDSHSADEVYG